jgi:hypothetical protein
LAKSEKTCLRCRHFRNSPRYMERVYPGMATLSSGYASVRKDDGICLERDLYRSADGTCDRFDARAPVPG